MLRRTPFLQRQAGRQCQVGARDGDSARVGDLALRGSPDERADRRQAQPELSGRSAGDPGHRQQLGLGHALLKPCRGGGGGGLLFGCRSKPGGTPLRELSVRAFEERRRRSFVRVPDRRFARGHDHRRARRRKHQAVHHQRHRRGQRTERRAGRLPDTRPADQRRCRPRCRGRSLRARLGGRQRHRGPWRQRRVASLAPGPTT